MIIEKKIYNISEDNLLKYLLNVLGESSVESKNISLSVEKCLEILEEVMLKMNEVLYFSDDAPEDIRMEKLECCKIKLSEVGSILMEKMDELENIRDDLDMNKFVIRCNMEEDSYEL